MEVNKLLHILHLFVQRQLEVGEDLMHHLRAFHLVSVECPAGFFLEFLGQWLGDVVQHCSPSEPEVSTAIRHIIKHFQGVIEVVLMSFAFLYLYAFQRSHLRENQW